MRDVKRPDVSEADLEKTEELPMLDVAFYEARLGSDNPNGQLTNSGVTDAPSEAKRSQAVAELPAAETFRDVEAWVAAQESRARTHERVLAELQAARSDSQTRADTLTLELEGAQRALHTALCRANDGERAALKNDVRARAAEGRIEHGLFSPRYCLAQRTSALLNPDTQGPVSRDNVTLAATIP